MATKASETTTAQTVKGSEKRSTVDPLPHEAGAPRASSSATPPTTAAGRAAA